MQSVVLSDDAQRPWREDARVMGLVGVAHASSHFSHLLLPLMFPVLVQEFGWRYAELGMLSSLFFVISGLGQAGAGFVVDRWGARPVLMTSIILYILACLQAYAAQSYAGLMVVAVLAGLGNAPFHPVNFTILNQRVSTHRLGYAFSVHGVSGNLGWALAPVFFSVCAAWWGWRHAFLAASGLYVLILVLLVINRQYLVTTPAPRAATPGLGADSEHALAILRMPVVWWCFFFFLLSTVTLAVVQNFAVPILNTLHGISLEKASMTLTAYMLLGAVGILIGGFLAARFAQVTDRVVALCMAAAALLMALCASGWLGPQATLWLLALTGFAVGIGGPSRDLMIKKGTPKEATGRVYGLVYSGLDVGFALSPLVFGVFMDQGWYTATLLGAAVVLFISAGVALGVGQRSAKT